MRISEDAWIDYIRKLRKISDEAASQFSAYLLSHDVESKAGRQAAIDYAYALSTKYSEGTSALSCEMYDAVAAASKAPVPAAEPAETPTYGEVAKAVNGTLKQSRSPELPGRAIGRLVKRTGVDTTMKNAIRDGAEWAWIPHGDTCAFCMMLASRGWQRASKKAMKGGHAEHIHANCDCTYAIRFGRDTEYAGYDPDKYLEAFNEAEGRTWEEKVNSIRRERYAGPDGDRIREQKRVAYARNIDHLPRRKNVPYDDVTDQWRKNSTPGSHKVMDLMEYTAPDGQVYRVQGKDVVLDYTPHEKEIAELLEKEIGGELYMVPRVNKPEGVSTADYQFQQKLFDLKTITGEGKNVLYNAISKKKRQSANFVFDISKTPLSTAEVERQIEALYTSKHTQFVEEIVLVKNGRLLKVYRRKK